MKVVFTDEALRDLDDITDWVALHYPGLGAALERRLRLVVTHIGRWPYSARRSSANVDIRVMPLGRYPYKVFYRVTDAAIQILHIHHTAREPWDERTHRAQVSLL